MFKIKSRKGLYLAKDTKHIYWTWRSVIALQFNCAAEAYNFGEKHATFDFIVTNF